MVTETQYIFSPNDYNALVAQVKRLEKGEELLRLLAQRTRRIPDRARVERPVPQGAPVSVPSPTQPEKNTQEVVVKDNREKISPEYMKRNFGTDYASQVLYYDFDSNTWNTNKYLGFYPTCLKADAEKAESYKKAFGSDKTIGDKIELVASVFMAVDGEKFPGVGMPMPNAQFCNTGVASVVKLVVRDKANGKLQDCKSEWMGADIQKSVYNNAEFMAYCFFRKMLMDKAFCNTVCASFAR